MQTNNPLPFEMPEACSRVGAPATAWCKACGELKANLRRWRIALAIPPAEHCRWHRPQIQSQPRQGYPEG
jgi:hypothetical protein